VWRTCRAGAWQSRPSGCRTPDGPAVRIPRLCTSTYHSGNSPCVQHQGGLDGSGRRAPTRWPHGRLHTLRMTLSSSALKAAFLTSGESWLHLAPEQLGAAPAQTGLHARPQLSWPGPSPHHRSLQLLPERLPPNFLATCDHEKPGCLQPPRSCCITSHRRWSSCACSAHECRAGVHGKRSAVCGRYFSAVQERKKKRPADLLVPSPFHHIHRKGRSAS